MTATVETFKARFPNDFDYSGSITDDIIQTFLDLAQLETAEYNFGTMIDEADHNLTAHLIYLEVVNYTNTGSPKDVQSESVEDMSVTFASKTTSNSDSAIYYNSTRYGARYWSLLKRFNWCGGVA